MRFNPETPWQKNYAARFRPLTQQHAEAIQIALYDSMQATGEEINRAVASMCGSWQQDNSPTVNNIAEVIRSMRYGDDGLVTTPNTVRYYDRGGQVMTTTMRDLKLMLDARPDASDAWNIVCTPLMIEQCRELLKYCENRGIRYERFTITPETAAEQETETVAAGCECPF